MDHLREIIHTLQDEEKKEFILYIHRLRKRKNRKDEELFELLNEEQEYDRKEILDRLYPNSHNLEAYHATRKRLIKEITEFISLNQVKSDPTQKGLIQSTILMCEYLFNQRKELTAWKFLKRAEEMAQTGEHYDLLTEIYSQGIENSLVQGAPDINELIEKRNAARENAEKYANAKIANFLIRNELQKSMEAGVSLDVQSLVNKVLKEYNLKEEIANNARLAFNILSITRSTVLAGKDFYNFEPYLKEQYQNLLDNKAFNKYTHQYKVQIMYWIAHTLYRNKKFDIALKAALDLQNELEAFGRSQKAKMQHRLLLLLGNLYAYTGDLDKAIESVEELLSHKTIKQNQKYLLEGQFNLSMLYFFQGNFNKALRTFQGINHSDNYLSKIMGKEWLLKLRMVECLSQYEMGNSDLVEKRIATLRKNFHDFLKLPMYQRVEIFLKVLEQMNNNPIAVTSKDFKKHIDEVFVYISVKVEDLQAMTFFSWIKAKMFNQDFYRTVIETAKM